MEAARAMEAAAALEAAAAGSAGLLGSRSDGRSGLGEDEEDIRELLARYRSGPEPPGLSAAAAANAAGVRGSLIDLGYTGM